MENLPKIIKDERGQLRVLVSETVLLNDSELTVVQNVGMKGKALVTCTFEADLSEYKTEAIEVLRKKVEDLNELIEHKNKHLEYLDKEYDRERNRTWYQKLLGV